MDRQPSFSDIEFAGKKKMTRREAFLKKMEALIPWVKWVTIIEGVYPKGERGRPPIGAEKMLRIGKRKAPRFSGCTSSVVAR